MSSYLEIQLFKFLQSKLDESKPVLLALSGGPDSMALWQQLLAYRRRWPLRLAVVHVDHAWRKESEAEAQFLKDMVESEGVPFYGCRLDQVPDRNREEQGRDARLHFFASVMQDSGAQAVLLGHHRGDQAETVLKRLLEGASLVALRGLEQDRQVQGVRLWRPWLRVSKKQILKFLSDRDLNYLKDSSNDDTSLQRNRFRHELWPALESSIGKSFDQGLCRLGEEALEVRAYLDARVRPLLARVEEREGTWSLALRPGEVVALVEAKHLLRAMSFRQGLTLPADILNKACEAWVGGDSHQNFFVGAWRLSVERASLSLEALASAHS